MTDNTELLIGLGLFFVSEAIGLSKARENSVLQVVLKIAMRAFPYEIRRLPEEPPAPPSRDSFNRPKDHRRRRDG